MCVCARAIARCFWYSNLFQNEYGLDALKPATQLLQRYLPHASIGANFAPFVYSPGGFAANIYMCTPPKFKNPRPRVCVHLE